MDELSKIALQLWNARSRGIKQNLIHHLNERRRRALKFFITFEKTAEPVSSSRAPEPAERCVEGRINIGRKSGVEIWAPAVYFERPAMPVVDKTPAPPIPRPMNRYRDGKWVFTSARVISITATYHAAAEKRALIQSLRIQFLSIQYVILQGYKWCVGYAQGILGDQNTKNVKTHTHTIQVHQNTHVDK